jgi:hypothetical protein
VFAQDRKNDLPDPIPKTTLRYQKVIAGEHWFRYFCIRLWKNQHLSRWNNDLDLLWLGLDAVKPVAHILVVLLPILYRKFSTK